MLSDLEKQDTPPVNGNHKHQDVLERVRTAGTVSIPPELFEQMFLAPETRVKGDLRVTFGNPTGIAMAGFLLCTTPLSMILLGWEGAGGLGAANVGTYFYCGGLLLILGCVGEWILGNTFPATVFATFGSFWLTFGATLVPFYNAVGAYATDPAHPASGLENPQFYNTFGFYIVAMDVICTILCIASIRTNVCFFVMFLMIIPDFACLAGYFFAHGHGHKALATTLLHVSAGLLLALTMIGWWIFLALMLLAVDFPIILPLGDLSTRIKGYTDRKKARGY